MHTLTRDRVRLIRALIRAVQVAECKHASLMWRVVDAYPDQAQALIARIRSDEDEHYLSYSQDEPSKVSYAAEPVHKYDCNYRIKTTFGRYIRRRLNIKADYLPDTALTAVSAYLFGSLSDAGQDITIISGEGITDAFVNSYGGYSCMTEGSGDRVRMYELNPDKVSLIKYQNGIEARALLWTTDGGDRVLDRIYPNSGAHVDALHHWADRENIIHRGHQHLPDGDEVPLSDGSRQVITLQHKNTFPYLDTFHFGHVKSDGTLTVCNYLENWPHRFEDTGGSFYPRAEIISCYGCGEDIDIEGDNTYQGLDNHSYCQDCFYETFSTCEDCNENVLNEDIVLVYNNRGFERYICTECRANYFCCDKCRKYFNVGRKNFGPSSEVFCNDCFESVEA